MHSIQTIMKNSWQLAGKQNPSLMFDYQLEKCILYCLMSVALAVTLKLLLSKWDSDNPYN